MSYLRCKGGRCVGHPIPQFTLVSVLILTLHEQCGLYGTVFSLDLESLLFLTSPGGSFTHRFGLEVRLGGLREGSEGRGGVRGFPLSR